MKPISGVGSILAADAATVPAARWSQSVLAALMAYDGTVPRRLLAEDATNPNLLVALREAARELSVNTMASDAVATTVNALMARAAQYLFDGTNEVRARGNYEQVAVASAARTVTADGSDITVYNTKGGHFRLDITAVSGTTPTLDVTLELRISSVSSQVLDVEDTGTALIFGQQVAVGTATISVYPGLSKDTTGAYRAYNQMLSQVYRFTWTIGGTTPSFTFGIYATYAPN